MIWCWKSFTEGRKFVPGQTFRLIDFLHDGEFPGYQGSMQCWPRRQHGEAALQILARRESSSRFALLEVAQRLGYRSLGPLYAQFPELSRAITAKYHHRLGYPYFAYH